MQGCGKPAPILPRATCHTLSQAGRAAAAKESRAFAGTGSGLGGGGGDSQRAGERGAWPSSHGSLGFILWEGGSLEARGLEG